jgi:hypothetical protein
MTLKHRVRQIGQLRLNMLDMPNIIKSRRCIGVVYMNILCVTFLIMVHGRTYPSCVKIVIFVLKWRLVTHQNLLLLLMRYVVECRLLGFEILY